MCIRDSYKVCRGSFSGTTSSFGVRPNNLTNFLYLFDDASKRLQDVIIENKDCLDIIRERDGPDSLIYCDPPYFEAESAYDVEFPTEKHKELHKILTQCEGLLAQRHQVENRWRRATWNREMGYHAGNQKIVCQCAV